MTRHYYIRGVLFLALEIESEPMEHKPLKPKKDKSGYFFKLPTGIKIGCGENDLLTIIDKGN